MYMSTEHLTLDEDPAETAEWQDAFRALLQVHGPARARFILQNLECLARQTRMGWQPNLNTPYINTIPVEAQPAFPGDLAIEERIGSLIRWNARAPPLRARSSV